MRNYLVIAKVVKILAVCSALGCANLSQKELRKEWRAPYSVKEISLDEPQELVLKLEPKRQDKFKHSLNVNTDVFEGDQILRERREATDFVVVNIHKKLNKKKELVFDIKTLSKDGPANLTDLAFPEVKKTIETHMTADAKVKFAAGQNPGGIFYLPPISLPKEKVKKGDTWTLEHYWKTDDQSAQLELNVVSILKRFVTCDFGGACADIEISGEVYLTIKGQRGQKLSQLEGRIHFSLEKGAIIWSSVKSEEELKAIDGRVKVQTSLVSVLEK